MHHAPCDTTHITINWTFSQGRHDKVCPTTRHLSRHVSVVERKSYAHHNKRTLMKQMKSTKRRESGASHTYLPRPLKPLFEQCSTCQPETRRTSSHPTSVGKETSRATLDDGDMHCTGMPRFPCIRLRRARRKFEAEPHGAKLMMSILHVSIQSIYRVHTLMLEFC
jgi:hypothetical protein